MFVDLHTYSRASGGAPAEKAVSDARAAGLDGVCFADREGSAAVAKAVIAGAFGDFPVFVGVEIPTRGGDAVLIVPEIAPFYTHEEWRELTTFGRPALEDVVALAERLKGVVLLAHPYDRNRKQSPRDRMFAHEKISGVEVGTCGADARANTVALEAVSHAGVPAFGGSASKFVKHGEPRWATLFAAPVGSQTELIEQIKGGNFWAVELFPPGVAPRVEARFDGPRRDDRGPRDDRGGDRGPRRDDRGPRPDRGGDRGPRRDDRGGDRGPRRDDRGPRPDRDARPNQEPAPAT